MGGLTSLNKGKRAERQVVALLQPLVNLVFESRGISPPLLQRNTIQSDCGGFDIVGLEWMALEVKHQEQLHVDAWWGQCEQQAREWSVRTSRSLTPILIYRRNNVCWRVRMIGYLPVRHQLRRTVVDIGWEEFTGYFTERLEVELKHCERKPH